MHHSGGLFSSSLTLSNQHCMPHVCTHIRAGLLPSSGTPSHKRGSCYQMVKQTHRPTAHNSNPLSTLLSTCLSLIHHLSPLQPMQEGLEEKNNAEIMRISEKFLGGVFNFNQQDYPSLVALVSPPPPLPRLPRCTGMKGNSEHLEWQHA